MNEGSRQLFWLKEGMNVPSDYQIVIGHKVNNGAYIDTGLELIGANTKIEAYGLVQNAYSRQWNVLLGAEYGDNSDDSIKIRLHSDTRKTLVAHFSDDAAKFELEYDTWHFIQVDGLDFSVDGQTKQLLKTGTVRAPSMFIGNENYNGQPWGGRYWPGAIGLVSFFDKTKGKLVGQFVPVKRVADGICGFYDTVTKQFFTSQSSTQFQEHVS